MMLEKQRFAVIGASSLRAKANFIEPHAGINEWNQK